MQLDQKVAIVTGAGSGIGRAIAERLAGEGASIVVADIDPEGGAATVEALRSTGRRAVFTRTDVAQEADVRAMIDTADAAFGSLDILINNAGINWSKPFLQTTLEDWERVLGTNLRGTFLGCRYAIEHFMTRGKGGCIVNISSVHSVATMAGTSPYAAAKGGMNAMTRSLAIEFGRKGIRVNAVCPGSIATRIWDEAIASVPDQTAFTAHWYNNTALGRVAAPLEVANLVNWLCTDEAGYVTGACLFVDGGMTAMLTNYADG